MTGAVTSVGITTPATAAMVTENTKSETTGAGIVTGVVISAGIITFVTATTVIACVVLKKKYGKKEQKQASPEHTYESIPLPAKESQSEPGIQEEPDRTTHIAEKDSEDETVEYDDMVFRQNVQESYNTGDIQMQANEAYSSFNVTAT